MFPLFVIMSKGDYDVGSTPISCAGHGSGTEARERSLAPLLQLCHVKATFYPVYHFFRPVLLHHLQKCKSYSAEYLSEH